MWLYVLSKHEIIIPINSMLNFCLLRIHPKDAIFFKSVYTGFDVASTKFGHY